MVPILTTVLDDWSQGPVLTIEESKMDVDGFILLNQPQAMVLWLVIKMREKGKGRIHKMIDPTWRTDQKANGYRVDGSKATWHPHGLSSPQEIPKWNILRLMINPSQWNHYIERIP